MNQQAIALVQKIIPGGAGTQYAGRKNSPGFRNFLSKNPRIGGAGAQPFEILFGIAQPVLTIDTNADIGNAVAKPFEDLVVRRVENMCTLNPHADQAVDCLKNG